jgi:hypothetical protein
MTAMVICQNYQYRRKEEKVENVRCGKEAERLTRSPNGRSCKAAREAILFTSS